MKTKFCNGCKEILSIEMFEKGKHGVSSKCRKCRNKYFKEYRQKNKEKISEYRKQYKKDNKEKISEKDKLYYQKNVEKIKEYRDSIKERMKKYWKEYRKNNKEKIAERLRQNYQRNKVKMREYRATYREKNREKINIWNRRHEAKKRELPHTLTVEQWEYIKQHFNNRCAYCGKELPLQQEHFIPVTKGGEYTINNIVPACKSCNCSKHNKDFFEWYPKRKYYSKRREIKILKFLGYKDKKQQLNMI